MLYIWSGRGQAGTPIHARGFTPGWAMFFPQ